MIKGTVKALREAIICLTVAGRSGQEMEVEVVIDTGFNGHLTLAPGLIAILNLPWRRRGNALLADGSSSVFDVYEATIIWDGKRQRVPVDCVDCDPLAGMSLIQGYELLIQVIKGGDVMINPLPSELLARKA
ncbi:MAG: clan AA aspartic protease [Blastocatellales bacterium]